MTLYTYRAILKDKPYSTSFNTKSKTGKVNFIWHKIEQDAKDRIMVELRTSSNNVKNAGTMEDINTELSHLNILQDSVKKNKDTPLYGRKIETFMDSPYFDGRRKQIKRNIVNKLDIKIPEIKLREINKKYESEGKRPIKDIKGVEYDENKPAGERKSYILEQVEIYEKPH